MRQIFEIEWDKGKITPILIESQLRDYFRDMGHNLGTLTVTEIMKEAPETKDRHVEPIHKTKSAVMEKCKNLLEGMNTNHKLVNSLNQKLLHVQIPSGMSGSSGMSGVTSIPHPLDENLRHLSYKIQESNRLLQAILDRIDI